MTLRCNDLLEVVTLPPGRIETFLKRSGDIAAGFSENTKRGWLADWRTWSNFCRRNKARTMPADLNMLRAFFLCCIKDGRKRATLDHYRATITRLHRFADYPNPFEGDDAELMWRTIVHHDKLSARQHQAEGLNLESIEQIVAKLDLSRRRDARDAALIRLAFETLFRVSEVVALQCHNIAPQKDGGALVFLPKSKTDQLKEGFTTRLSPEGLALLNNWYQKAGITEGTIFRSVSNISRLNRRPERQITPSGLYHLALQPRDVITVYRRCVKLIGLEPKGFSTHSTRVGAAQELTVQGFSGPAIMQQGRWKSLKMVARYTENITADQMAMATMLRKRGPK